MAKGSRIEKGIPEPVVTESPKEPAVER